MDGILYFNMTMPNELPTASAEAVLCNVFAEIRFETAIEIIIADFLGVRELLISRPALTRRRSKAVPARIAKKLVALEKLLHVLLEPECLRAEWYEGGEFFETLDAVLSRNEGGFTHEALLNMPDLVGPEFEIMLHRHEFQHRSVSTNRRRMMSKRSHLHRHKRKQRQTRKNSVKFVM